MVVGEFTQEADLVVIGGGPAGYAAAFRAAELGVATVIVESREALGGVCLHDGCVPSKTLAHVAESLLTAGRAQDWGVSFGAASIDAGRLAAWTSQTIERLAKGLDGRRRQHGVEIIRGRACFEDSRRLAVRESAVPRIRFRRALIATGSRPAPHPALPADHPAVWTTEAAVRADVVPGRLLIVGDDYQALEVAVIFAALGSQVTIAGAADRPLPEADEDLVRPLVTALRGQGVTWCASTAVTGLTTSGDAVEVTYDGAAAPEASTFDRIVVSAGRVPNVDGLELGSTGVTCDAAGFVVVDEQMRTEDPRIFAAGDVTGPPLLADLALHQGRIAADVVAGRPAADDARVVPVAIFTEPQIAWCGLTESQATADGVPHTVRKVPWGASGRAVGMGRPHGLTKILHDPESRLVLGVGFVGPGATELVSEAAAGHRNGGGAGRPRRHDPPASDTRRVDRGCRPGAVISRPARASAGSRSAAAWRDPASPRGAGRRPPAWRCSAEPVPGRRRCPCSSR